MPSTGVHRLFDMVSNSDLQPVKYALGNPDIFNHPMKKMNEKEVMT